MKILIRLLLAILIFPLFSANSNAQVTVGTSNNTTYGTFNAANSRPAMWSAVSGTGRWYYIINGSTGTKYYTSPDASTWTSQGLIPGSGFVTVTGATGWLGGFDGQDASGNMFFNSRYQTQIYTSSGWNSGQLTWSAGAGVGAIGCYGTLSGTGYLRMFAPQGAGTATLEAYTTNPGSSSTTLTAAASFTAASNSKGNDAGVGGAEVVGNNFVYVGINSTLNAGNYELNYTTASLSYSNTTLNNIRPTTILGDPNLAAPLTTCVDSSGNMHVLYQITYGGSTAAGLWETVYNGSTWSSAAQVAQFSTLSGSTDTSPSVMCDHSGTLHIFYCRYNGANDYGIGHITRSSGSSSGGWTGQTDLVAHNSTNRQFCACTKADPYTGSYNQILVSWQEGTMANYNMEAMTYNTAGTPAFTISPASIGFGTSQTETATGSSTSWVSGTTTFSVSGGTGASISGLSINNSTQVATFTLNPGTSSIGTNLIISDSTDSYTQVVTVIGASFTATPTIVPNSHSGNITLTLAGTATGWVSGTTVFTLTNNTTNTTTATKVSQNITGLGAATLVITTGSGSSTGSFTISDGVHTQTVNTANEVLVISPSTANTSNGGQTFTLTDTSGASLWTVDTPTFTIAGSATGTTIGSPSYTSNTVATVTITTGSTTGTETITDPTTSTASNTLTVQSIASAGYIFVNPCVIPANHNSYVKVYLHAYNNPGWSQGTTVFTLSGTGGSVFDASNRLTTTTTYGTVTGNQDAYVLIDTAGIIPATPATGIINVTDPGGTTSDNINVIVPTISLSVANTPSFLQAVTSVAASTNPTLTIKGNNTLWSTETTSPLFSITGFGNSFTSQTSTTTPASVSTSQAVFALGSTTGAVTVEDLSTGATASLTVAAAGTPVPPVVSVASPGFYSSTGATVTLTCATGGTSIYYTMSNSSSSVGVPTAPSVPTTASTLYTGPFTMNPGGILKVISSTGSINSSVQTYTFYLSNFYNGQVAVDTLGQPLYLNDGNIIQPGGTGNYYRVAENRGGIPTITLTGSNMYNTPGTTVDLYTSPDLYNWTKLATILPTTAARPFTNADTSWIETRPHIEYNPNDNNFVVCVHWKYFNYALDNVAFYTSPNLAGGGSWTLANGPTPITGTPNHEVYDETMFVDPQTGIAYLVFDNNSVMSVVALDTHFTHQSGSYVNIIGVSPNGSQEAPTMLYNSTTGYYYLLTSILAGFNANAPTYANMYATSTSVMGTWTQATLGAAPYPSPPVFAQPSGLMSYNNNYAAQNAFVFQVPGTNNFIYNSSQWVQTTIGTTNSNWLPIQFGSGTTLTVSYLPYWNWQGVFGGSSTSTTIVGRRYIH